MSFRYFLLAFGLRIPLRPSVGIRMRRELALGWNTFAYEIEVEEL